MNECHKNLSWNSRIEKICKYAVELQIYIDFIDVYHRQEVKNDDLY